MGGDLNSDEEEDQGEERKIALYNPRTSGLFVFFTHLAPSRFFRRLENYLREKDVAVQQTANKWQMTFKVERELDDQEIEEGLEAEACEIRVDLLKIPQDDAPTAVKFSQVQGSLQYFNEQFDEIENYFEQI